MDIPEEPGAVLVSILVISMFLFLLVLQRGSLSERQQTCVWVVSQFCFSICNMFVHGSARTGLVESAGTASPAVADIRQGRDWKVILVCAAAGFADAGFAPQLSQQIQTLHAREGVVWCRDFSIAGDAVPANGPSEWTRGRHQFQS